MAKRCCECGAGFRSIRADAEFCGTPCRKAYNNRRAVRGAQIYDVLMNARDSRTAEFKCETTEKEAGKVLWELARQFREEDAQKRMELQFPAYRSYTPWRRLKDSFFTILRVELLGYHRAGR